MYVYSYLKSAVAIIDQYTGEVPLAIHLKTYFKLNKKIGSRDRRQIAQFCYCYYRTGHLFKTNTIEEKIKKSFFLSSHAASSFLQQVDKDYNAHATLSITEKLAYLGVDDTDNIFPTHKLISSQIDKKLFVLNQLQQPYLYLRIRPKSLAQVLIKLNKLDVAHTIIDPYTVRLPNGFAAEQHFDINKEVVIQDYSSQQVLNNLLPLLQKKQTYKVWDCCAASGGKSILLSDLTEANINLFVTDIRETILHNLQQRFFAARVMNYKSKVHNVAKAPLPNNEKFDVIICDAPCSGSGTWARTPEQAYYFKEKQLSAYTALQNSIAHNALKNLREGGWLLYITCSVFTAENEDTVSNLQANNKDLRLLQQHYINGYTHHADTMFVALLQK